MADSNRVALGVNEDDWLLDAPPVRVSEEVGVGDGESDGELDADREGDRLEEKEELGVIERLMERLTVRVRVGVTVNEGGIAIVPAKL